MNNRATLQIDGDGVVRIEGDLTVDTVPALYEQASGASPRTVDLADAGRIDSSGLALLLEWQAAGERDTLEVLRAPEDLLSLARLCGAEKLLHLGGRGEAVAEN